MGENVAWIIFDADNTLWDVESIYDHYRRRFAIYLKSSLGLTDSIEDIEQKQNEIDVSLSLSYGYAASRFPRSFEETTLIYLKKPHIDKLVLEEARVVRDARELGEAVFNTRACNFKGSTEALLKGKDKGYDIAIYTAGEYWVQDRRLKQSGLLGLCDTTDIQMEKTVEKLRDFCQRKNVDINRSFLIGDSLKSDIYPAKTIGLNAIHIPNKNWSGKESSEISADFHAKTLTHAISQIPRIRGHRRLKGSKNKVRLIFEGGGAKGIAHIGGLKALEEASLEVEATAGSSAGAIIAGLCAAGYRADDLLKVTDCGNISNKSILKNDLIQRIGKKNWKSIKTFRNSINFTPAFKVSLFFGIVLWLFAFFLIWELGLDLLPWYILGTLGAGGLMAAWILKRFDFRNFGLASLDNFTEWYDNLLRNSPVFKGKIPCNERVKFSDFDKMGANAPVIIASDISNQRILALTFRKLSDQTSLNPQQRQEYLKTNDMSVADAVAASAALPVIFEPRRFDSEGNSALVVDGGMLSNLPAWSLAEGREQPNDRLPIIGFELTEKSGALRKVDTFKKYISRLISTSISGVRSLETRGIEGLHVIRIGTDAGLTDFDMAESQKVKTFADGRSVARESLMSIDSEIAWALVNEEKMRPVLQIAYEECLQALRTYAPDELHKAMPFGPGTNENPVEFPHLRVNIMVLNSLGKLRVAYKYGMDGDADDDLALDEKSGAAGIALLRGSAVVADMEEAQLRFSEYYRMTKYQQALVRPTLKALVSVPMSGEVLNGDASRAPPVHAVVNFDSDDPLVNAFAEPKVRNSLYRTTDKMLKAWGTLATGEAPRGHEEE